MHGDSKQVVSHAVEARCHDEVHSMYKQPYFLRQGYDPCEHFGFTATKSSMDQFIFGIGIPVNNVLRKWLTAFLEVFIFVSSLNQVQKWLLVQPGPLHMDLCQFG